MARTDPDDPLLAVAEIRLVTPTYFVATKLVAFGDPGRVGGGDFVLSHDLEDIVTVLRGVDGLLDEIGKGNEPVHHYVRQVLRAFLADRRFLDALPGHFEPDAATQATVGAFVARLRSAVASR